MNKGNKKIDFSEGFLERDKRGNGVRRHATLMQAFCVTSNVVRFRRVVESLVSYAFLTRRIGQA